MDHLADGAGAHQFAGLDGRAGLEMLGIQHRENAAGLGLYVAQGAQFVEADHARLVAHHVLAVAHGSGRNLGAVAGDGGGEDQLDRGVLEDRGAVGHPLRLRISGAERLGGQVVLDGMESHKVRPPLAQQAIDLPVDVAVVEADGGEMQGVMGCS